MTDRKITVILFLLFGWSAMALASPDPNEQEKFVVAKIIGGKVSKSSAWPWMAAIVRNGFLAYQGQFCGGSLIAPRWVLTAAHCVSDETAQSISVVVGRSNLMLNDGEIHEVSQIIIHPEFYEFDLKNDIALLELSEASLIQPIETLSDYSAQDEPGRSAVALGWGTTLDGLGQYPADLYEVELPIVSNQTCKQAMPSADITESSLCAGDADGGKDTCTGDSGGPLVVFDDESQSWRQAGITSYGLERCAYPGQYGVYTRLEKYKDFISETICTATQIPIAPFLTLSQTGVNVTAEWTSDSLNAYRLYYAPYPGLEAIYSLDMNQANTLSVTLSSGQNFYVAVRAYDGNCISDFSNIESFIIP